MVGVFCFSISLIIIITSKFMPFLFSRSVYMCKSIMTNISIQEVPHFLLGVTMSAVLLYILYVSLRFFGALYQYKKFARYIALSTKKPHSRLVSLEKKYHFLPHICVFTSQKAQAFSIGFFRRNIFLSTSLLQKLNDKEIEAVVLHEYTHIHNFDSLKLCIAFIIETMLSFIPSLKELTIFMRIDREIKADNFAVSMQKTNTHILSSLKKLLDTHVDEKPLFIPRFAASELIDARIYSLINSGVKYKKKSSYLRFALSIVSLSTLFYLALAPVHAEEININGKTSVVTCSETSPQCLAICEANASYLNKNK